MELIGSGLDEAAMGYKNIYQLIESKKEFVEVLGSVMPEDCVDVRDEKFKEVD